MLYIFKTPKEAFKEYSKRFDKKSSLEYPNCVFVDKNHGRLTILEDFKKLSYPIIAQYDFDYDQSIPESFHVLSKDEVIKRHALAYEEMNKCLYFLEKIK